MLEKWSRELSRMDRELHLLKYKIVCTVVLPVFLVILGVKVVRTYIHIRMRQIAGKKEETAERKASQAE